MASLHERLTEARELLVGAGVSPAEAALDAELLARHVLECDRATLLIRSRAPLPSAFDRLFAPLVARRAAREPTSYIVGHREFWGLDIEVTRDVLIPRPETELIVEEALAVAPRLLTHRIIDVGTGSGCLAVALAVEFPSARVIATDISPAALRVAERNAQRHQVSGRVSFVECDLLAGIEDHAQLIVSNPPYVPTGDVNTLQPEVAQYEPASALYAGDDGLAVIRRLFSAATSCLAEDGRLITEFGFGQEAGVRAAATDAGWHVARVRNDLQGIPRVAVLTLTAGRGAVRD
jgi:release factor glutamine methyltransferase